MATTITAVQVPAAGAVDVTVTSSPAEVGGVLRVDSSGSHLVRHSEMDAPWPSPLTLRDRECPLSGPVTYVAVSGAEGAALAQVSLTTTMDGAWLTVPQRPGVAVSPTLVLDLSSQQSGQLAVHEVIGRRDPVTTAGVAGSRRPRLQVLCADHETAQAVAAVYATGDVVLVRQAGMPGLTIWHQMETLDVSPRLDLAEAGSEPWAVDVSAVEVAAPESVIIPPGWTYDDLLAGYSSYTAVMSAFGSYTALLDGPS